MNEVEARQAATDHMQKIVTARSVLNAAETRAQVMQSKSRQPGGERFKEYAEEAMSEMNEKREELEELESDPIMGINLRDAEGTKPGLADINGNYAPNREVANAGGVRVLGSNSKRDGTDVATSADEAGTPGKRKSAILAVGGGVEEVGEEEADEEDTSGQERIDENLTTRQRGRKARKGAASKRKAAAAEEEEE